MLFQGGCVLTLSPRTRNFARADLLIEDDRVAEVGPGLRARDAEVVDASDAVLMPGLVDGHRHAWRSLLRNLDPVPGSNPVSVVDALREQLRPEDLYAATLASLLSALEAGVTTVVDHCDAGLDEGLLEAALQAHIDSGLRTILVCVVSAREGATGLSLRTLLSRLTQRAGPRTRVAVGTRDLSAAELDLTAEGWTVARELGLRAYGHAHPRRLPPDTLSALARRGLLHEGVTLVHFRSFSQADVEAVLQSGASVVLTPSSEMAQGVGAPPIQQLLDGRIVPGLGVEDERLSSADLFTEMRTTIAWQHAFVFERKLAGKGGLPRLMTTRDVIRYATVEGARTAGLHMLTGSLEPGMQADLIVLRTDRPNIFPVNDPIGAVVWGMDPSNLDWVIVGGRVLLREGTLQADSERARRLATAARDRLLTASGIATSALGRQG